MVESSCVNLTITPMYSTNVSGTVMSERPDFVVEFVSQWGTSCTGDGEFYDPRGVAGASDGSVYVSDYRNHRIQKFTLCSFVARHGTKLKNRWG